MADDAKKKKEQAIGCAVLLAIGLAIFLYSSLFSKKEPDKPPAQINAKVNFTGTQFVISNLDSFDWQNVKMEVNETFKLDEPRMTAGQTHTVGAMQFAKTDGTRFNPLSMKTQKFSICADTPNGLACYVGEWNK